MCSERPSCECRRKFYDYFTSGLTKSHLYPILAIPFSYTFEYSFSWCSHALTCRRYRRWCRWGCQTRPGRRRRTAGTSAGPTRCRSHAASHRWRRSDGRQGQANYDRTVPHHISIRFSARFTAEIVTLHCFWTQLRCTTYRWCTCKTWLLTVLH